MHKFIRSNKNPNTRVYVCDYTWPIEINLRGRAIVVRVFKLEDILSISRNIEEATKIEAFVYRNEYASLETIDINPEWGKTPVILYINRLGQFRDVHDKVEMLRGLNVMVIFTGSGRNACKDAQILSSLGVHSGVEITPDSDLSEELVDLITYSFYSMMPHGDIEPFATMARYYDGESYVSPAIARFVNPDRYFHVNGDLHVAFSPEDLAEGRLIGEDFNSVADQALETAADGYAHRWQEMFVDSHSCTFCPAFRICMGYFYGHRAQEEGRCIPVMTELLEAIEFSKQKNQSNRPQQCRL